MLRYIRAFFIALRYTLSGKVMPSAAEKQHPALFDWMRATQAIVQQVYTVAEQHGYDPTTRGDTMMQIEGRSVSMETLLSGIRYHVSEEYPYLLSHLTDHSITAIYAANLNDRYYAAQLTALDELPPPLREQLTTLSHQLDEIPSTNQTG